MLEEGGVIYTATDVQDLHEWMVEHLTAFPLFQRLSSEETSRDEVVPLLADSTEEGTKVGRAGGTVHIACFKRIPDDYNSQRT